MHWNNTDNINIKGYLRRCDFFSLLFAVPLRYINRHLKMSFLLFDSNHTSKQRVHIREVTLQAREFCLKRAINYISLKGSGAQNRVLSFAGSEVEGVILFLYCLLTLFNAFSGMWFLFKEVNSCSNKRLQNITVIYSANSATTEYKAGKTTDQRAAIKPPEL